MLANSLHKFYACLRNKDGALYSKSAYVTLRSSLNRHLNGPPFNMQVNLMRDKIFTNTNQVFVGILHQLKESGKDLTKHKSPIRPGDMSKMYSSGVLGVDNTLSL